MASNVPAGEALVQLLDDLDHRQVERLRANDPIGLANCYHPEGILLHRGVATTIGRTAIAKALIPYCTNGAQWFSKPEPTYSGASNDGEYLIRRAEFFSPKSQKKFEFEQIYKRLGDDYFLLLDSFELDI